MQRSIVLVCLAFLAAAPMACGEAANPIQKVIEMLSGLEAKIIAEGEEAQKMYDEFSEWCEDTSRDLGFEIKTGKAQAADLQATIDQETSTAGACAAKAEDLAAELARDEADLKAAGEIRESEAAAFAKEEAELMEIVDMLQRAIAILEREMAKGASMMQLQRAGSVAQALSIMVQASVFSSADASRLTALVQSSQQDHDADADDEVNAPAAAVYEGHSGGIIATLEGLLEKAEAQLDKARKTETSNLHNYEVMKQALTDEIKYGTEDLGKAQKCVSEADEAKAAAEGDLAVTSKDLAEDEKSLADLHSECMTKAQEFEAETKSRDEELKALAEAKKVISESTGGVGSGDAAETQTYGLQQLSLLQLTRSRLTSGADLANFEAVRFLRDLARKENFPELAQLASRMSSAMRMGAAVGDDPFAKVKGLISDLIARLEKEAAADATHKAYCDKELGETRAKKAEKDAEVEKLTTAIDKAKARSAQLKDEVATLQKELAELAQMQAEMDKLRSEEKALYDKNRPEMEAGLEGVKLALKILREYYAKDDKAHEAAEGAGGTIIGLLEVIESDLSKGLAEMIATEEAAAAAYDKQTKENEVTKTTKEQDVKYKTKEFTELDKLVTELSSDLAGVQEELDAVLEYLEKLKEMCIAKPETYEYRKERREKEIAGLREALSILEGAAVLLQDTAKRTLRGSTA